MTLKECIKFIEQYEKESKRHNISESLFGFECSECGVIIRDCDRWEYDRDSDCYTSHLFECSYCPNCGRMVVIE